MKKKRTGIIGVLIAILALGIGYAAVSAITLTITGTGSITATPGNFVVEYTGVTVAGASTGVTTTQSASEIMQNLLIQLKTTVKDYQLN